MDVPSSSHLISATFVNYRAQVNEMIQADSLIIQSCITCYLAISKERVGYINEFLGYRKICARCLSYMLTEENKH